MPTKTKPKRHVDVPLLPVTVDALTSNQLAGWLGVAHDTDRAAILKELDGTLAWASQTFRQAPVRPLPAHIVAEVEPILADVSKLQQSLRSASEHARRCMADTNALEDALASFAFQAGVLNMQMKGRPKMGGGGKRHAIKLHRDVAAHGIGIFWDLHARNINRTWKTSDRAPGGGYWYCADRKAFVDRCMELVTP